MPVCNNTLLRRIRWATFGHNRDDRLISRPISTRLSWHSRDTHAEDFHFPLRCEGLRTETRQSGRNYMPRYEEAPATCFGFLPSILFPPTSSPMPALRLSANGHFMMLIMARSRMIPPEATQTLLKISLHGLMIRLLLYALLRLPPACLSFRRRPSLSICATTDGAQQ